MSFKEDFDIAVKTAKRNFEKDKNLYPLIIAFSKNGSFIVPFKFEDDEEKRRLISNIKKKFKEKEVYAYITVNEAWALKKDKKDDYDYDKERPSTSPHRFECVVITGISKNERYGYFAEIKREGDKVSLVDEKIDILGTNYGGALTELIDFSDKGWV